MGTKRQTHFRFRVRQRKFAVATDKLLFFKVLERLHGRFWGVATIQGFIIGMSICFAIRPEMFRASTAFSDFGNDVRTAPYFAGTMFFAAYGLWRWRNYLTHTLKRSGLVLMLITCTILGLYLVALMPVGWHPWPYRLHFFGVFLAGISMMATVIADGLLTKVKNSNHVARDRLMRLVSVAMIIGGGYLTYGSAQTVRWFNVSLLGELVLFGGYGLWVVLKTVRGEGPRSRISALLHKIVTIS